MSTGQLAGGVAGGIAGALLIGSGVGIAGGVIIGGLLAGLSSAQKTVIEIGKRSDRTFQGSEYGGDIPRVYGTVGLSGSQIIWMENNQLKEVVKKKKSGGKGGASTVTKTYSYYATFALMLCQGEIAGIRRIWCSDKLIYNAGSDDLETIIASNQAAKGWRLYRGTDDQLPDPRYEADVGVGNAPAFRGYTYIVFDDFALADYSNTLQAAQFKVEVVNSAETRTSILYRESISYPSQSSVFILFNKRSAEIARTAFRANIDTTPETIDVYRTSGIFREPFPLGGQYSSDLVAVGDLDYALMPLTNDRVVTNIGVFATYPALSGAKKAYYDDGLMYVLASSDGTVYVRDIIGAVSHASDASDYLTFTVGDAYVYALTGERIDILYKESLSLLSSAPFSSDFTVSGITYCSFDDGVLWVLPQEEHPILQGYDASTGERTHRIESDDFASLGIGGNGQPGIVVDGVIYRRGGSGDSPIQVIAFSIQVDAKVDLEDVVSSECLLSNLIAPIDLDVSLLTQSVTGYRVSGGTIRSVIEPLQGAYPFDVVPSGYKIKFIPRGQSSVMTIPWEDLAATDGDEIGDSLPYSREMDSQLPQKVSITALSSDREYGSSTQYYERLNTTAVNTEDRDIPLVLSDDEIAQMAEKLLFLRWLERDDFDFSLPPSYLAIEPSDVVMVEAKFGDFELRLAEINYESDGRLTCKAKLNNAAIYISNAIGATGPGPDGTIPLTGESIVVLMDIPVVDETLQNSPGFVVAMSGYTDGWGGGVLVQSPDGGQTWSDLQSFQGKCTFGTTMDTLPASNCTVIDQRVLTVSLISGELESITRDQMLAGLNYAAYGRDGRWEIVRFQTAALQSDGTYRVSGFVRGQRGTEWASGLHQRGDYFVLLDDPDNAFIGMPVESIGTSRLYRAITSGATIDSASDQALIYRGVNLECLSPVYAKGARDGSSNFSGAFTRRSRLSSSWWTNGVVAPIGETTEAYEIDVMSGSTVKRTIAVTSPAWSYSAANQATDFGTPQSSITFRIYQLSTVVGRGYPLEVTL
ncbi:phage tail protein [Pseudomonas citronellolis]|uniref:phage tail protein n=1 Tax=Pseudomonas citronellolis TaxID=53408 RepID=UPI0009EB3675|nr:phage tail protein [Pseudomonas citronellolis]